MDLSGKHRKILEQLLRKPTPRNINWYDVEVLLLACGAKLIEGAGSRVKFRIQAHSLVTHRQHPQKEAKPYQIRDAIEFLRAMGLLEAENL